MIDILKKFAQELKPENQAVFNKSIDEFNKGLENKKYMVIDIKKMESMFDQEKVEEVEPLEPFVMDLK